MSSECKTVYQNIRKHLAAIEAELLRIQNPSDVRETMDDVCLVLGIPAQRVGRDYGSDPGTRP